MLSSTLIKDPLALFTEWFNLALAMNIKDANAMTLATTSNQRPSARTVLLKQHNEQGFVFFTNYLSRKSIEINNNPHVALTFFWPCLEKQIRIEGVAETLSSEQSDYYFQNRPRGSQLSAWASQQSQILTDWQQLETTYREYEKKFAQGFIPRPEHWGGYCVKPHYFEFWSGRENRLHQRIAYQLTATKQWDHFYLSP